MEELVYRRELEQYRKKDIVHKYGEINNWDVSNVTNMNGMFSGTRGEDARSFNQPLNNWNVSKVTYVSFMFDGASSFNQPLNNWDVSNVGPV